MKAEHDESTPADPSSRNLALDLAEDAHNVSSEPHVIAWRLARAIGLPRLRGYSLLVSGQIPPERRPVIAA